MADMLEKTTNAIVTALIAVVLIASALLPIAFNQIDALSAYTEYKNYSLYISLLSLVIVMAILGIIIGIIRSYNLSRSERMEGD